MLAAGLGSLAHRSAGDLRTAALVAALGVAAVVPLAWAAFSLRRAAIAAAAGLAGVYAGSWTDSDFKVTALVLGGAVALLRRPGDPPRLGVGRAVRLACAGALAAALVATLTQFIHVPARIPVRSWAPYLVEALGAVTAAALVLGAEVGARASRRMGRVAVVLLLVVTYAAHGVERGSFCSRAEVRLDTGDIRYYALCVPFVPVVTDRAPEPVRERLLELAKGSRLLRAEWRPFAPPPFPGSERRVPSRVASCYAAARRWVQWEPKVARAIMEDLAEWVEVTEGRSIPECWDALRADPSHPDWPYDDDVWGWCHSRGLDPTGQAPAPPIAETEEGLRRQLSSNEPFVRAEAAQRLGERFSGTAAPPLIAALEDSEPRVRCAAARALGALGDPSCLPALRRVRARDPRWAGMPESTLRQATTMAAYDEAIARLEEIARAAGR